MARISQVPAGVEQRVEPGRVMGSQIVSRRCTAAGGVDRFDHYFDDAQHVRAKTGGLLIEAVLQAVGLADVRRICPRSRRIPFRTVARSRDLCTRDGEEAGQLSFHRGK